MPRSENQKKKLILILRLLQDKSDENHYVSMSQILDYLNTYGVEAERKSIYSDIEALKELGYDIISVKGRDGGYFLGERDFELAELKILVDAIQASRFITAKKSKELIQKISNLGGTYNAQELKRDVFVLNRAKSKNDSFFYSVDAIHTALRDNKKISYKYVDYNVDKQVVYRHDGAVYDVSPLGLVWNNERYYLIGFDHHSQEIRHYRVDRMKNLSVSSKNREIPAEYKEIDFGEYCNKFINMFSGDEKNVTVRFPVRLVNSVIDQFGDNVILHKENQDFFKGSFKVNVSVQFFGWLSSFGNDVEILEPKSVRTRYVEYMKDLLKRYDS